MNAHRLSEAASRSLAAFILAAAWQSLGPLPAMADGMMLPVWDRELYEPVQVAFLRLDRERGVEHLTIMPKIRGSATDFAWVVPVPTLPEIAEADPSLLRQLKDMTQPHTRSRDAFWNCEREYRVMIATEGRDDPVEIVDEEIVGIFRTMTLAADDAGALVDSLSAWGFLHDGNREVVTELLDGYVQDDWYFVAMRVDSTAFPGDFTSAPGEGKDLRRGKTPGLAPYPYELGVQPVTFTFAADSLIYPLRISSPSAYEDTEVFLYVAAAHRLTFPGAETLYANRLSAAELQAVRRRYPVAGAMLAEGDFLTKLHRGYTPEQMTADIVPERAPDDGEYLPLTYSGLPVWSVLIPGSAAGWWVVRRRRRRRGAVRGVTPAS